VPKGWEGIPLRNLERGRREVLDEIAPIFLNRLNRNAL
jgi:hypothetical protein